MAQTQGGAEKETKKKRKHRKKVKRTKNPNLVAMRKANADALIFQMMSRGYGGGLGSSGSPFNQTYLLNQNLQQLGRELKSELQNQQNILEREREKRKELKPELADIKQNLYQNAVFTGKLMNDFYNQQDTKKALVGKSYRVEFPPTTEEEADAYADIEEMADEVTEPTHSSERGAPSSSKQPDKPKKKRKTKAEIEEKRRREAKELQEKIMATLTPKTLRSGKRRN